MVFAGRPLGSLSTEIKGSLQFVTTPPSDFELLESFDFEVSIITQLHLQHRPTDAGLLKMATVK